MEYGRFTDGGKYYEIDTPLTPGAWNNHLFNDTYYLEISQTLQGTGSLVKAYNRTPCMSGYRYFYLRDRESGEVWNPNYVPLAKKPDRYVCRHGICLTELTSVQQGIETLIRVTVPADGSRELWYVSLKNLCECERNISLYSVFGFYDHGVMGGECTYDADARVIFKYAFPYHTLYEEKEKAEKEKAYAYIFSDQDPVSCEMSRSRFFGNQGEFGIPEGVQNGRLSGIKAEVEDFCGAFSYEFHLEAGEERSLFLEAGAASGKEEVLERKRIFGKTMAEAEIAQTEKFWDGQFDGFYMETPDENLNAFGNYWLKKQITLLTRQNRGSSYCPVRNQLQDAMGYAMVNPDEAEKYIFDSLKLQNSDGFIQQWHDTTGAAPRGLCLLKHTDGPVWLVICTVAWIRQTGDREILYRQVPYADYGESSILEHMKMALFYLAKNCGEHGLCLIGDGDWNDPMNGVGREGRGESVWLSMALVYAIHLILPYLKDRDPVSYSSLYEVADTMKASINRYTWSEKQYAAAIHDDGKLVGDSADRMFLNTQSWALMSKTAEGERKEILLDSVKELDTPFGPLILSHPFEEWDPRWGRVSVKKSGTTENGSVYCHASMFLAFAQAMCKNGDALYEILWRALPTNPENPPKKNQQIPIYLANYYYGIRNSVNFGRSSRHYGTGTTAWMLMLIIEELLGAKADVDGLHLSPCLPCVWERAVFCRKYKKAVYHITLKRGAEVSMRVNGRPCETAVLPYEENQSYQVEMTVI